jgi:sulfur carrier protein ThiS
MRIAVEITGEKKHNITVPKGATMADILRVLKLKPDIWLVVVNGSIVPIDTKITVDDKLKLVRIVSGG